MASSSWTGVEVLFDGESDNGGLKARRKRRRRRRKGFAQSLVVDDGERDVRHEYKRVILGSVKKGYLSPKEEAEFSLCLKVCLNFKVISLFLVIGQLNARFNRFYSLALFLRIICQH